MACLSNASAWNIITGQNAKVASNFAEYKTAAKNGDQAQMKEAEENIEYMLERCHVRATGTYAFDLIFFVLGAIMVVIIFVVVKRTIVNPTRSANSTLGQIVQNITSNKGDLTTRIPVYTKDEVGQLAMGINGFLEQLQGLIGKMKEEAAKLMASSEIVAEQVSGSNTSAFNVSATMEQMSGSMQEISSTIDQIADASNHIFEQVKTINEKADNGVELVAGIKTRAQDMYGQTIKNKNDTNVTVSQIRKTLENAVKGFAVVADEIRVLADNSRDTASNIQGISQIVNAAVEKLSSSAEQMLAFVNETVLTDYDGFVDIVKQYQTDAEEMNVIFQEFSEETDKNQSISQELENQVSRFVKL